MDYIPQAEREEYIAKATMKELWALAHEQSWSQEETRTVCLFKIAQYLEGFKS